MSEEEEQKALAKEDLIKTLLKLAVNPEDVNKKDMNGNSALFLALKHEEIDVV